MQALSSNLADILDATPRRRVEFDMSRIDIGQLTLKELLDASDVAGISMHNISEAMLDASRQVNIFYGLAWVILRREDKSLTYEDVCEFDLIVTGEPPDDAEAAKAKERAKQVVAVAQIARVTPQEAESLTINQIEAATELQVARNRSARRGRRK